MGNFEATLGLPKKNFFDPHKEIPRGSLVDAQKARESLMRVGDLRFSA